MPVYKIHLRLPNGRVETFSMSARTKKLALEKAIKSAFNILGMSIRIERLKTKKVKR